MPSKADTLKWLVLLTVIVGTFLGRLDQTIVNLALPKIMGDFSITISEAGWIATAYILANAVFVPVWGKLGDTIGRKKVYMAGFTIFIIGSVLAGLSWDLSSMIVFRIIQAIASSADYPTAMAIIVMTFRNGKERAEALGIWSVSFAAAAVFGPLIGGPLVDTFGWRSVFLINLPVGLLGMAMAMLFINESVSEKKTEKFDIWGAITLGVALSCLVLVLDKGLEWGWTSPYSLLCYTAVILFGYLFYLIDSKHPEPLVDFKFFSHSAFTATLANNFVVFMGMMGCLFILPVFVQSFLGYTSTETGYLFMPMAFGMVLAAPLGAQLIGRVRPGVVIAISTFGAAIGIYMFSFAMDARATALDFMIPIFVMAFSMGFAMSQRTSIIASTVPDDEVGEASSVLALTRNIAGAFGIAIFASILNGAINANVLAIAQNSVINSLNPVVLSQVVPLMILRADILSYREVFVISSIIVAIGAALALLINVKETKTGREIMID